MGRNDRILLESLGGSACAALTVLLYALLEMGVSRVAPGGVVFAFVIALIPSVLYTIIMEGVYAFARRLLVPGSWASLMVSALVGLAMGYFAAVVLRGSGSLSVGTIALGWWCGLAVGAVLRADRKNKPIQ